MIGTGSQFGKPKTKLWLQMTGLSLFVYFVMIKPIIILLIYVTAPALITGILGSVQDPTKKPTYPYKTPLPEATSFYVLQWHPELRGTKAADAILARAFATEPREPLDDAGVKAVHAHTIPRRDLFVSAGLTITSILFALNEELQDILLEEIFCFTPMLSAPVLSLFPDALLGGEGARAARRFPTNSFPGRARGSLDDPAYRPPLDARRGSGRPSTSRVAAAPRRAPGRSPRMLGPLAPQARAAGSARPSG